MSERMSETISETTSEEQCMQTSDKKGEGKNRQGLQQRYIWVKQ
jgi:hypothetical protein